MQSIYSSFIPGEDAFASKMLLPRRGFFAKNTHPMEKRSADGGGKRDKSRVRFSIRITAGSSDRPLSLHRLPSDNKQQNNAPQQQQEARSRGATLLIAEE